MNKPTLLAHTLGGAVDRIEKAREQRAEDLKRARDLFEDVRRLALEAGKLLDRHEEYAAHQYAMAAADAGNEGTDELNRRIG